MMDLLVIFLFRQLRILLPLFAATAHCALTLSSLSAETPESFFTGLLPGRPQLGVMHGVLPSQVLDFASVPAEFHNIPVGPSPGTSRCQLCHLVYRMVLPT